MITKAIIRGATDESTYEKGLNLYNRNSADALNVHREGDYELISALIQGYTFNRYQVDIKVNVKYDTISRTDCRCPAFYSYGGLCQHCVATLLSYVDYKERMQQREEQREPEERLDFLRTMRGEQRALTPVKKLRGRTERETPTHRTTPVIKELLAKQALTKALPILQEETYGKVVLEPHLQYNDGHLSLVLKVGIQQMYSIKDVFSFTGAMANQEDVRYGQRLRFVHHPESFTEESRGLVSFVLNWAQQNRERYQQMTYYGSSYGSYSTAKVRAIPLKGRDLEEFLLSMGEQVFLADMDHHGEKKWKVERSQTLRRTVKIVGEAAGIRVKLDSLQAFQGSRYRIYFFQGSVYLEETGQQAALCEFITRMSDLPSRVAFIENLDVPSFCRELLPQLEQSCKCVTENFSKEAFGVVPAKFEFYLDSPQQDMISCRVLAVYGENKYSIYGDTTNQEQRDLTQEALIKKLTASYCNAYDEKENQMILADDEDKLYELIVHGLPRFHEAGEVYVADAIKNIKVRETPRVAIGVSLAGTILELKLTSEDMPMEELVDILSRYNRKKKYHRLKNGEFINVEGDSLTALLDLKQGLNLSATELNQETITVPKYRALYLDAEMKDHPGLRAKLNRAFQTLVQNMKTVEEHDFVLPEGMDEVLREYQKRGFFWIKTLNYNGFGGILADDMGLGKTLQVICFLVSEFREARAGEPRRCLIVSPASLVYNWKNEFERFAPELPVTLVVGTAGERRKLLQGITEREIIITSYDLLKRDLELYHALRFQYQVIDEAQYIKNHSTQASQAVKEIDTGFRLALTGTPIENRLSELWSIFDYLMPGFLYAYSRFRDELEIPIVQNQSETAMKRLQKMIQPFVLRRLKKEVLTELPDKLEENIFTRLEGEQQKLYDAHVKRMQMMLSSQTEAEFKTSKLQILSELTRLRQICCDPSLVFENYRGGSAKADMCLDLIRNAVEGGHKLLLFSQFTTMLEHLKRRLMEEKIGFYSLTGSTSKERRMELVEAFNRDSTPVFCISLKAGGTGLNLTAADIVIHYDPWWNVAVQNQATDRAHRIGQEHVVSVYKLVAKGTIEEGIMNLQEKKQKLADQLLGGEGMNAGSFTKEELLELLR